MLSSLIAIGVISFYVVSSAIDQTSFNDWIHPNHIQELKETYYLVFDHNNDGQVTTDEIAIGVLSQAQSYQHEDASYIPETFTCIPSLDFVDFADCISIAARQFMYESPENKAFEDIFSEYLADCTDISPYDDQYCYDIVESSPEQCMIWSRINQPYCKLSCYSCEHEPEIFNQQQLRGINREYRPRKEKLTTYYPPEGILGDVKNCTAVKDDGHTGQILFISDIHIEPWYNVDGTGEVSRFSGATMSNIWQCHDSSNKETNCTLNGKSDPPYPLWLSGMEWIRAHASPQDLAQTILIMGGDTQAHSYTTGTPPLTETVPALMDRVTNEILSLWKASNIFYAAGNNDGQHNSIFCSGSDPAVNAAWALPFIKSGIVNNALNRSYTYNSKTYNSVSLFNVTGYYIKKIPSIFSNSNANEAFYAIILNTNLGTSNAFQNALFSQDLEWISKQNGGSVLIIGHHPNVVQAIIPKQYQSIVKGSFSGHVHYFQPTDSEKFTILPATTQAASYVAVMTADLDSNGDIVMNWDTNFNQYFGEKGTLAAEDCWGYNGQPAPLITNPDHKKEKKQYKKWKEELKKEKKKHHKKHKYFPDGHL